MGFHWSFLVTLNWKKERRSTRKKLSLWRKKREPLSEEQEVVSATLIEVDILLAEEEAGSFILTLLVEEAQLVPEVLLVMVARIREGKVATSVDLTSI